MISRNSKSVKIRGAWPLLGEDFDPLRLDEGIRDLVVDLNQADYQTLASCQGGKGHHWSYEDETHNDGIEAVPRISINGWCTQDFANRARMFDLEIESVAATENIPFEQTYISAPPNKDYIWFCGRVRSLFCLRTIDSPSSQQDIYRLFFGDDLAHDGQHNIPLNEPELSYR